MACQAICGRVTAPDFTADFESVDGRVRHADQPLRFMMGWRDADVRAHVAKKGWKATRLLSPSDKEVMQDENVQAVLRAFPGATIANFRKLSDAERASWSFLPGSASNSSMPKRGSWGW